MKYLRRFNEELKAQTYKNAANKLKQLGHVRRGADLEEWGEVSKSKELERKRNAMIDMYSKHGVFKIDMKRTFNIDGLGNFYLFFEFDKNSNAEEWEYWQTENRFDGSNLWILLDICLIPADDETFEVFNSYLDNYSGPYYLSTLHIRLSDANNNDMSYDSGEWELTLNRPNTDMYFIEGNEYKLVLANRSEAVKFRKLVIDVFEGNVEMGVTSNYPGGIKEQIIDFYCNERGVSIEEFENVVDSIRKITVNYLYKD